MLIDFSKPVDPIVEAHAKRMAEAVNGGRWEENYTESQKRGWMLKVVWAMEEYGH